MIATLEFRIAQWTIGNHTVERLQQMFTNPDTGEIEWRNIPYYKMPIPPEFSPY